MTTYSNLQGSLWSDAELNQITLQSFPADSHANRSAMPGSGADPATNDSYGRKCFGSSAKSGRAMSWVKMFLACYQWESKRSSMIWKVKVTKSRFMYYQLAPSAPGTNGNASLLWPTPRTAMASIYPEYNPEWNKNRGGDSLATAVWKAEQPVFPTPTSSMTTGRQGGMNLQTAVKTFPTPAARDWKSGKGRQDNGHTPQLPEVIGGQLNPEWVEWLMGFPEDWTKL